MRNLGRIFLELAPIPLYKRPKGDGARRSEPMEESAASEFAEREIFLDALDVADAGERAAFLARACGGDERLRRRVEALLESHRKADAGFLGEEASTPGDAERREAASRASSTL